MAYCVFRSDLMSGTDDASALVSCRVYDATGKAIAVENGTVVELQGYEDGQREVMKAVLATANSNKTRCAVIGSEEVMYDERKKNLDEFINEAGSICRGYIPRSQNKWSVTKEGFVGGAVPEKNAAVGIGAGGKLDIESTKPLGVCLAVENVGRYTYYVICVD